MTDLSPHEQRHVAILRIAEGLRDVGILLFTFAPLDFFIDSRSPKVTWPVIAGAMVVALLLFSLGVVLERGIYRADAN